MGTLPGSVSTVHAASTTPAPSEVPQVDITHALQLYRYAHDKVTSDRQPDKRDIFVRGVVGVRVDIRWQSVGANILIGFSEVLAPSEEAVVNLTALTQTALDNAQQMIERRRQRMERRELEPNAPGNTNRQIEIRPDRLSVELQVGLRPQLITSEPGKDIYEQWAFGHHGLHMIRRTPGQQAQHAVVWPGTVQAINLEPKRQLFQLMQALGYRPAEDDNFPRTVMQVGQTGGPTLRRFEVIHLIRAQHNIVSLDRGMREIPIDSISRATVASFADRIAQHLTFRQMDDGSVGGTYNPTDDTFSPTVADPAEIALVALALAHRGNYLAAIDPESRDAELAINGAGRATDFLIRRLASDRSIRTPALLALMTLNISQTPALGRYKDERDRMASELIVLQDRRGRFRESTAEDAPLLGEATQALITAALAAYAVNSGDAQARRAVELSRTYFWTALPPEHRFQTLPWMSFTEAIMHGHDAGDASATRRWPATRKAMHELGDDLMQLQVQRRPSLGPGDVVGGFEFTQRVNAAAPPNPDWRSSYAMLHLAIALRLPEVIKPDQRADWVLSLAQGARFLGQLTFDEVGAYYARPDAVVGGVRLTLWNNQVGVGPTAMALLALTELQKTLDQPQ